MVEFRKFIKGIRLPDNDNTGVGDLSGSLSASDNGAIYHYQNNIKAWLDGAEYEVTTNTQTQTLTNKTIDADSNTISNIDNDEIKAAAGIDATKIGNGDVDNTELSKLNGLSGDISTDSNTQTLTNKTIDGDDNTIQDLALSALKTLLADADKFIQRDASGAVISGKAVPSGDVVGNSDSQTLTNKAIDADSNTISNIDNDEIKAGANIDRTKLASGTADHVIINDGTGAMSSEAQLAGTRGGTGVSSTATFPTSGTVNTGTGTDNQLPKFTTGASGIIGDSSVSDDGTNLVTTNDVVQIGDDTTGANKKIQARNGDANYPTLQYNETSNKWEFSNDGTTFTEIGAGGGAGGINHVEIDDSNAENGTGNWALYNDSSTTRPVDGTGGTATGLTFAVTSSAGEVLRGTQSFKLSKDAADRQGSGVAILLTIPEADETNVQSISLDYKTTTNYADGDIIVYGYDASNTTLVEPVPIEIFADENGKLKSYFQVPSGCTSFRLIFHVASTNATAYDFIFDNVRVGPAQYAFGTPEQYLGSLTTTGSWVANTTYNGKYWRRGDKLYGLVKISLSGTPTTADLFINLPSGYSIDSTKLPDGLGRDDVVFGEVTLYDANNNVNYTGAVAGRSSTTLQIMHEYGSDFTKSTGIIDQAEPFNWTTGDSIAMYYEVPIQGWGTQARMSDDAITRTTGVFAEGNSGDSITANVTNIPFNTESRDEASAWNGSVFTAPVSAWYDFEGVIRKDSNFSGTVISAYVDGTIDIFLGFANADPRGRFSGSLYLEKGQTLSIRVDASITLSNTANQHWIRIINRSGPSQITASELVKLGYKTNAGQSIPDATETVVVYEDVGAASDSHSTYNTSTGVFTAPFSGSYLISAGIRWANTTNMTRTWIAIWKNSTEEIRGDDKISEISVNVNGIIDLNKGDQVTIRAYQDDSTSASRSLGTYAPSNYLSIVRQGF